MMITRSMTPPLAGPPAAACWSGLAVDTPYCACSASTVTLAPGTVRSMSCWMPSGPPPVAGCASASVTVRALSSLKKRANRRGLLLSTS
jgi:hypothetical protein